MEDVHVFGAILYTGDDHTAHASSCIFGGSDVILELADEHKLNVKRHVNNLLALIRCVSRHCAPAATDSFCHL
jgi:hypothetical protein